MFYSFILFSLFNIPICFSFNALQFRENDNREVALKIVKSANHYKEAAEDEIKLLDTIREGINIIVFNVKMVKIINNLA